MNEVARMQVTLARLHPSAPEQLPFAPGQRIRAFLLQREQGNFLIYSTRGLGADGGALQELGAVSRHYLNHWHESMFIPAARFGPLIVHQDDSGPTSQRAQVDETFSHRHKVDSDFEVLPIPGHTQGATAFLWDNGQNRLLFTGDTIYLEEGEWVAAVLDSSDRDSYIASLELIRELDFDVLVPWAASAGYPYYSVTDPSDARRRIDAILQRLRRGEDR